jgi:hypothetical protein
MRSSTRSNSDHQGSNQNEYATFLPWIRFHVFDVRRLESLCGSVSQTVKDTNIESSGQN